jgi:hypothetical protein
MIFNRDYEPIVTNGLVLNLDAGFTPSYSQSGVTWYDVSMTNTSFGAANLTFTTRGTRGLAAVSSALVTNQWYYVVCKREAGVNSLYINNTVYTYSSEVQIPGDTLFKIGTSGVSYWFNGNLALIQLYNRALTATEIPKTTTHRNQGSDYNAKRNKI